MLNLLMHLLYIWVECSGLKQLRTRKDQLSAFGFRVIAEIIQGAEKT